MILVWYLTVITLLVQSWELPLFAGVLRDKTMDVNRLARLVALYVYQNWY